MRPFPNEHTKKGNKMRLKLSQELMKKEKKQQQQQRQNICMYFAWASTNNFQNDMIFQSAADEGECKERVKERKRGNSKGSWIEKETRTQQRAKQASRKKQTKNKKEVKNFFVVCVALPWQENVAWIAATATTTKTAAAKKKKKQESKINIKQKSILLASKREGHKRVEESARQRQALVWTASQAKGVRCASREQKGRRTAGSDRLQALWVQLLLLFEKQQQQQQQ